MSYVPQNIEEIKSIHVLIVISNTMYCIFHLKFVALQFISASPAPLFGFL